jgi:hypothetical protein
MKELLTYHQHCCDDEVVPITGRDEPFISLLKVLNGSRILEYIHA